MTEYTQSGNGHFLKDIPRTLYTLDSQWSLSDGKISQAGREWGYTPIPFQYISTITHEVVVYAPAERADTFALFILYPYMYSGVHSIMVVKSAPPGEGGGAPLSLYLPSRAKLWGTLQLRGQIHSPYFSSTPTCTL
jgi:hypothetical protein